MIDLTLDVAERAAKRDQRVAEEEAAVLFARDGGAHPLAAHRPPPIFLDAPGPCPAPADSRIVSAAESTALTMLW